MSNINKVDVIIFGATGYTGKCVVQEFIKITQNKYTWAVAGRNSEKLTELLDWASLRTGQDVLKIPIIIADCEDVTSLNNMARSGRVIINCCGPYRFYGESVIKACIENGTHHVDVSGEPEYMESIQLEYHEAAESMEVYIVSACGFDSVPADLGVIHLINNFVGQVNSIESYMECKTYSRGALVNIGTWQSAVYGFANQKNLIPIRKKLLSIFKKTKLEPRLQPRSIIHKSELFNNKYSIPFPGSDRSVVFRTQMFLHNYYKQRPVQYNAYYVCPSLTVLTALIFVGLFLQIFTKFSFGRRLLLRHPEFFSFGIISQKGPSEESLANTFACFKFKGEGWSKDIADEYENKDEINVPTNKCMFTEISFPSPAYGFTSKSVILSAVTILNESEKMPSKGGVYTPGGAFSGTSFLDELLKTGVSLKIVDNVK